MSSERLHLQPLVSVIIPCFNQGRFLAEAIRSVQRQTYANIEIIVIDDGSADDTREVSHGFANVQYYRQTNAGLSGARNTGIQKSNGLFLVFLDADDILYANAIELNLQWLLHEPSWAFVSGAHDKVDERLRPMAKQDEPRIISDHYQALLQGNYIGMHATVMYRRTMFSSYEYDIELSACEDYDLYLKIARDHSVGNHTTPVAAYRHHGNNMSRDHMFMLSQALKVHARQLGLLKNDEERRAWHAGLTIWRKYYAELIYEEHIARIFLGGAWPSLAESKLMAFATPTLFKNYFVIRMRRYLGPRLKRVLPDRVLRWMHNTGWHDRYVPAPGKVHAGDFSRITPFSTDFGFDRGGAIDRFYIESFLDQYKQRVRGKVLEIGDNAYTVRYGGDHVLRSEILHVDDSNSQATYIGDITNVPQIPSGEFDCIIFTQTLHLIYDFKSALKTCYRILKPGGSLLLTVPGISHIDKGEWRDYWLWSFTDASVRKILEETFCGAPIDIKTYGNVYVAAAFLYGMGLGEFRKDFLYYHDKSYQVIISAAAEKV